MKRGAICLLVFGLTNILNAAELGLEGVSTAELKEIEEEIAKGNVPPNFSPSDKPKRGVAKLTNADTPSFNSLSSATSSKSSSASTTASQAPLRYVYNNQYYPSNPYLSYLQPQQHAAQIAAQYAFQPAGVTHYLQTPTQIQYVTSPSISGAGATPTRYQTINSKASSASYPSTASVSANAAAASPYLTAPQQFYVTSPQSFIPQTYAAPSTAAYSAQPSTTTTSQSSSGTQMTTAATAYPQQYYYPQQQPIVMLLVQPQPHPMALLYPNQAQQSQQQMYLLGQHPLLNFFGGHRFGLPYAPQTSQVTYLVPMAVTSQQTTGTTSTSSTSNEKSTSNAQETSSSNAFGVRTSKA